MDALELLRAMRTDVANGKWAKGIFLAPSSEHRRCLVATARRHIGWEEFSEPLALSQYKIPIEAYDEALETLANAIIRVFPRYKASDNTQTIIDFNDSPSIRRVVVLEVLDAAILDVEQKDAIPAQV